MNSALHQPASAQTDKDQTTEGKSHTTANSAAQPQDEQQDSAHNFGADWEPLQGGYQAIVAICEEARSRRGDWSSQHQNIYDPERVVHTDKAKTLATMPLPEPFCRRGRLI